MVCSPRPTGETMRFATWLVAFAVVVASCGGGDDDAQTGVTTSPSPTATTASVESASPTTEPIATTIAPTTAAPAATTTAPPPTAPPTTAAPVGPPSTELLLPGDDRFFDALGAEAFVMEGATVEGTTTAVLGGNGAGYQTWLTDRGEVITWLHEGQLFREVDGLLEPTLFPGGLFPLILDAEIGFPIDSEFVELAQPVGWLDLGEELLGSEFLADPEDVLAYQRADHPEWWEWEGAQLEIVGNHGGAIVSYRETSQYTIIAPSNMVDPPPPRDVDEAWIISFEPTDEAPQFPAERIHPDADDILARQLVDRATSVHSRAIEQIFFADPGGEPEDARPVVVDDLNENAAVLLPERFGLSFGTIEEAGGPIVGYEDNTLVIESASGTWFCQLGRPNAGEIVETPITGSGNSARDAFETCRSQRA